jgi:hypothetical protein
MPFLRKIRVPRVEDRVVQQALYESQDYLYEVLRACTQIERENILSEVKACSDIEDIKANSVALAAKIDLALRKRRVETTPKASALQVHGVLKEPLDDSVSVASCSGWRCGR